VGLFIQIKANHLERNGILQGHFFTV